jgi:hypothetical protein
MYRDRNRFEWAAVAVVSLALAASGCGDEAFTPTTFAVQLMAEPSSIGADGSSTITVQVTNNLGQTPSGIVLEWSNSFGELFIDGGATDSSGRASARLVGQGAPGVATVTAKIFARSEQGQVQVRVGLD